jgi:hypothetical protein
MFAAIASGGTIGVADQYLCILLLSLAARFRLVELPPVVGFMAADWFIIVMAIIWVATILPAYGSLLDPVFLRVVNTTMGVLSGVLVPASGALLALATANFVVEVAASAGHLATLVPLRQLAGAGPWLIGSTGALIASFFTFVKFLIKPMIATATGMTATTATASVYKTVENVMSLVLMALIYFFVRINPWLLVLLVVMITVGLFGILIFAFYKLWQLGQGIGRVFRLFEKSSRAGFAVMFEPFLWGVGWMMLKGTRSGINKFLLCGACLLIIWFVPGILFFWLPPLAIGISIIASLAAIYFYGLKSATQLLQVAEQDLKAAVNGTIVPSAAQP